MSPEILVVADHSISGEMLYPFSVMQKRTTSKSGPAAKPLPRSSSEGAVGPRETGRNGVAADSWRRDLPYLVPLFLLALALRIAAVIVLRSDLRIQDPMLDGRYYLDLATRLAQGGRWPAGPVFMTPLYPLLLSLLFRWSGPSVAAAQLFQSVLGLGTLALLYVTARRDLGRQAALGAAVLYALSGPILAMEHLVLTETLLLFLAVVALWAWPGRSRASWAPAVFGVASGMLAMGRGTFLLLPAVWAAFWLFRRPARRNSGVSVRAFVLVIAGLGLTLLPLTVYQTRATGRLQVLTLNGGMNLYLGNNPMARGLYSIPPNVDLEKDMTGARSLSVVLGRALSPTEADAGFAALAYSFLRERPGRALWLLGRKALLYLSPREIPQIESFEPLRDDAWPLRVTFVDFRWILPLAALGMAAIAGRWAGSERGARFGPWMGSEMSGGARHASSQLSAAAPWLLLLFVGWLTTTIFFATGRYRIPFLPGFLGLAGLGIAVAADAIRRLTARRQSGREAAGDGRIRGRPWSLWFLVLPVTVAVQLVLPGYSVTKARAFDAWQIGVRESRRGNPEAAIRYYRLAANLDPTLGEAWHGTGAALVRLGRLNEAVEAYRRSLELLPLSPVTHYNLGAVYGRMGNDAAALEEFRETVRLDPFEAAYRSDLGVALARTGDRSGAVEQFRRALQLDPSHASARRGLEALGEQP